MLPFFFLTFYLNWGGESSENVHKNLPSDREFHENWDSESHALLTGVNKFLLMLLTSTVQFQ
jgi:hypothetical protein